MPINEPAAGIDTGYEPVRKDRPVSASPQEEEEEASVEVGPEDNEDDLYEEIESPEQRELRRKQEEDILYDEATGYATVVYPNTTSNRQSK